MIAAASPAGDAVEAWQPASQTVVLLCSSDNTFDVGAQVAAAFDRLWPDCPYSRFALTTTAQRPWPLPGWNHNGAGQKLGWRDELRLGLGALPASARHVLLVLDDFLLLAPVDTARAVSLIEDAENRGLPYLRLKPVDRSIAGKLIWMLRTRPGIAALKSAEPYYASLQLALWRREHLLTMLSQPGSIWDFEHQRIGTETHYAVTRTGPIRYMHVVEKGKWMPYAARLFARAGVPFARDLRPIWGRRYMVLHMIRKMRFALFGYSFLRLRSFMKSVAGFGE
jgi:hypothetical protein